SGEGLSRAPWIEFSLAFGSTMAAGQLPGGAVGELAATVFVDGGSWSTEQKWAFGLEPQGCHPANVHCGDGGAGSRSARVYTGRRRAFRSVGDMMAAQIVRI